MLLNELPIEIIDNISLRLDLGDKLSLLKTCKRLKDSIYSRSFPDTIRLYTMRDETEATLMWFRDQRSMAQRVKILELPLDELSDQLCSEIPLIFPNVEHFENDTFKKRKIRPEEVYNDFVRWKDTIKQYETRYDGEPDIIYNLLEKNVFSCLTRLTIRNTEAEKHSYDIPLLVKHAPLLKFLDVSKCKFTINDIESIHSSAPLLSTFHINPSMIIVAEEDTLPQEITPAGNMIDLAIHFVSIIDQNCLFLEYITRKYTTLIKLELRVNFFGSSITALFPNQAQEEQNPSEEYIATLRQIVKTKEAYSTLGSTALSDLPSTLRHLEFDFSDMATTVTLFTPNLPNLRYLSFFYTYGTSCRDQIEYIGMLKQLTHLQSLNIMLEPSIHKYTEEPLSKSVTNLQVKIKGNSPDDDMDLGWILSMFPSIKKLKIVWSGSRLIGYKTTPPKVNPNLTELNIGSCATHPKLLEYIRDCAPNLKYLYLETVNEKGRKTIEELYKDQPITMKFNEPVTKHKRVRYNIDLTGLNLECFYLVIDMNGLTWMSNLENVCICLHKKGDLKRKYVLSKQNDRVSFEKAGYKLQSRVKTEMKIKYDFTRKIIVNRDIVFDLDESKVILDL